MSYLGSFLLPKTDGSSADQGLLTYGGGGLGINPATQTLFLKGHDWYQRMCEVSLPAAPGQAAQIAQRCSDVAEGRLSQIDAAGGTIGGSLVWNNRLIVSAYSYYDADGSARLSHFASGLNLSQSSDVIGPVQVGTAPAGYVAGYMGIIPEEWRGPLGGPALTGQCCISIISRTSSGPSVSVFNPDDIGRVSPVPATMLLGYPLSHPLASNLTQNNFFNNATTVSGVAFPTGTRSVLFVGRQGVGPYCYGEASDCGDPVQIYKGEHAYPYVLQVWAYDANDLLAVKLGQRQPWDVRPYATWTLPEVSASGAASISGATYDPTSRRLYLTQKYQESPSVHVYSLGGGSGVGAPGLPSAPQNLTASIQGSQVSLAWSPPTSGSWVGYALEAGTQPGAADIGLVPLGAATGLTTQAPPGQYYVRVRAYNAQPALGPASNEVALAVGNSTTTPLPGVPTGLQAQVSETRTVQISWAAPQSGGAPTSYVLEVGAAPGANQLSGDVGALTSITLPGAPPGTYYLRVRARNAGGVSAPSADIRIIVN